MSGILFPEYVHSLYPTKKCVEPEKNFVRNFEDVLVNDDVLKTITISVV